MLRGYKTYVTAVVAIIGAVAGWLTADVSLTDAIQIIVPAAVGAFVRSGIANQ
jgi:hypothetical protein